MRREPAGRLHGCLLALLVALAGLFTIAVIVGVLCWQSASWLKNAPAAEAADYAPVALSETELKDVTQVLVDLRSAANEGHDFDARLSPQVVNGVLERILNDAHAKGDEKAPLFLRLAFEGARTRVAFTVPVKEKTSATGKYINGEVAFKLGVENGRFTELAADEVVLNGRKAPLVARIVIGFFLDKLRQENANPQSPEYGKLKVLKLLQQEDSRVHVILDGKVLQTDAQKQTTPLKLIEPLEKEF
jgi:hypothetical protein